VKFLIQRIDETAAFEATGAAGFAVALAVGDHRRQ